jgi:hypothetical protein
VGGERLGSRVVDFARIACLRICHRLLPRACGIATRRDVSFLHCWRHNMPSTAARGTRRPGLLNGTVLVTCAIIARGGADRIISRLGRVLRTICHNSMDIGRDAASCHSLAISAAASMVQDAARAFARGMRASNAFACMLKCKVLLHRGYLLVRVAYGG